MEARSGIALSLFMMGLGTEWIDKYLTKMAGMAEYVSMHDIDGCNMHDNDGCKITRGYLTSIVIVHARIGKMDTCNTGVQL